MIIGAQHNQSEIEDKGNLKLFNFSGESSLVGLDELVDWLDLFQSLKKYNLGRFGYNVLIDEWDMGASSVYPDIVFANEPSISFGKGEYQGYQITEDEIEKEIIFKMPPKRKYTVELELKSIRKATPNFVEEDFRR